MPKPRKRPRTRTRPAAQDPYDGMTDEAVLALARSAFRRAEALPPRSRARLEEWAAFDAAMAELMRRAMLAVLWKLHERGEDDSKRAQAAADIVELAERRTMEA